MRKFQLYRHIQTIGNCVILGMVQGYDELTGELCYTYFAAYMLNDTKAASSIHTATDIIRVSPFQPTLTDLITYCRGFNMAASMWKGISLNDWPYRHTVSPDHIDTSPIPVNPL